MSRMKMRGQGTRFFLVSATIPNIEDIAAWISSSDPSHPAKALTVRFPSPSCQEGSVANHTSQFGEEYRPCRLARHVVGLARAKHSNSFVFEKTLDNELYSVIESFSAGKPILIFVATRKGT